MFELKQVHVLRLLHALKVKGAFQEEILLWDPSFLPQQAQLEPKQNMQPLHTCLYVEFLKSCFTSNSALRTAYVFTAYIYGRVQVLLET